MRRSYEARLRRLERANRVLTRVCLFGSCAALVMIVSGQAKSKPHTLQVTELITVVDDKGNRRVVVGELSPGYWGLRVCDTQGRARLTLTHGPGRSGLGVYDEGGELLVNVAGTDELAWVKLRAAGQAANTVCNKGGSVLELVGEHGTITLGSRSAHKFRDRQITGIRVIDSSLRLIELGFGGRRDGLVMVEADKEVWGLPAKRR